MSKLDTIKDSPVFQSLTFEEFSKLDLIAQEKNFESGKIIIKEGETTHSLFVICSGMVEVLRGSKTGETPCVSHLTRGDIFGEMAFLDGAPATAYIIAQDKVGLLEFPYSDLSKLATNDSTFGMKLYKALAIAVSHKLKTTTDNLLGQILSSFIAQLGQMALSIGHEINNPLAIIDIKVQQVEDMLQEHQADKKAILTHISAVKLVTDRIARIIRGLKIVGRNSQNDPVVKTSVRQLVEDTIEFCSQRFKTSDVELDISDVPDDLFILCRPVQISQVLLNLLNNAHDAICKLDEKWVRVSCTSQTGVVQIAVTDSGPGISEEIERRMFHAFFTTKPPGQGTGLGLSLSRKIIESHGGQLSLNRSWANTRFEISLPQEKT